MVTHIVDTCREAGSKLSRSAITNPAAFLEVKKEVDYVVMWHKTFGVVEDEPYYDWATAHAAFQDCRGMLQAV